jgi:hypothetical protein
VIGVRPEVRGLGDGLLLYRPLPDAIAQLGFTHVDVVQIKENNFRSRSAAEDLGVTWHKRHRLYR